MLTIKSHPFDYQIIEVTLHIYIHLIIRLHPFDQITSFNYQITEVTLSIRLNPFNYQIKETMLSVITI